jgi:hypothetical protein
MLELFDKSIEWEPTRTIEIPDFVVALAELKTKKEKKRTDDSLKKKTKKDAQRSLRTKTKMPKATKPCQVVYFCRSL